MAAGAAIGPEVVVGAGVRVKAASGTEHLGSEENIHNIEKKSIYRLSVLKLQCSRSANILFGSGSVLKYETGSGPGRIWVLPVYFWGQ